MTARFVLATVALAALLAAPGAAAQDDLLVSAASFRGGGHQEGQAVAAYLSSAGQAAPLVSLGVEGASIEALALESRFLATEGDLVRQADPRFDTSDAPLREVLVDGRLDLTGQQGDLQIHVIAPAGSSVAYAADTQAGAFDRHDGIAMAGGQFREAQALDTDERAPESPAFWPVRIDGPLVVQDDASGAATATFSGDFTLEVLGAAFHGTDATHSFDVESGTWQDVFLPGLSAERIVLLRILVTQGTLTLGVQGGDPDLYIASRVATSLQSAGTLVDGTGQRTELAADQLVTLTPRDEGLALAMTGGHPLAPPPAATTTGTQAPLWAFLGAGAAVLVVVAGVIVRRLTAPTDLRLVEAALEQQRFGRAARLAKRVLRARPGFEDAVLGRAIALSKAGRVGAAIAEIHQHLAAHGASDGSLHYVLGLSFLDVGRRADARAALTEAVRLTPALAADVAARLTPGDDTAAPDTLREVHGYA